MELVPSLLDVDPDRKFLKVDRKREETGKGAACGFRDRKWETCSEKVRGKNGGREQRKKSLSLIHI